HRGRGTGRDGARHPPVRPPPALLVPARSAYRLASRRRRSGHAHDACGGGFRRGVMIGRVSHDETAVMFAKGHGTGNDFVILPDPDGLLPLTPRLVAALCDRRRGIGGDGVLRVVRSAAHPAAAAMATDAEWFM